MDGKKKWLFLGAAFLLGVMASNKASTLPLINKLPKF